MIKTRISLLACSLLCMTQAYAQVHKCTDARTGKVTYTDSVCATSEQRALVVPKVSEQDAARQRMEAADANLRVQGEIAGIEQRKQAREAELRQQQGQYSSGDDRSGSAGCAKAKRELSLAQSIRTGNRSVAAEAMALEAECGMPSGTAADVVSAQNPPKKQQRRQPTTGTVNTAPSVITSCDSSGCWDSSGTRYQRSGNVMNGPNGACTITGNAVNCP